MTANFDAEVAIGDAGACIRLTQKKPTHGQIHISEEMNDSSVAGEIMSPDANYPMPLDGVQSVTSTAEETRFRNATPGLRTSLFGTFWTWGNVRLRSVTSDVRRNFSISPTPRK
jgi:hypothetical protein